MKNNGFYVNLKKDDLETKIINYFTYLRKTDCTIPHKLHFSKEFLAQNEHREIYKNAISIIIRIIENGGCITPYLSKNVKKLRKDNQDYLFNNWGVMHLHLGNESCSEKNNFIQRTGHLLFMRLIENDAYFIKIYKHPSEKESDKEWSKLEIIQIMENNWPHTIGKLKGVPGLGYKYSDKERYDDLWKKGSDTVLEIISISGEPVIAVPPGGGSVASGEAAKDVLLYLQQTDHLKKIEKDILKNIEKIKIVIKKNGFNLEKGICFQLIKRDNKWSVIEKNSNMSYHIFMCNSKN